MLSHHSLKDEGLRRLMLGVGEKETLAPPVETGSGRVQEKEKLLFAEIISRVNDLFEGDLSEDDKLVYVNNVIKGKLMESDELMTQAANNTKEQFSDSPDLNAALQNAIMDALAAHQTMSTQALNKKVQDSLKDILLGPAQLYEALRSKAGDRPWL